MSVRKYDYFVLCKIRIKIEVNMLIKIVFVVLVLYMIVNLFMVMWIMMKNDILKGFMSKYIGWCVFIFVVIVIIIFIVIGIGLIILNLRFYWVWGFFLKYVNKDVEYDLYYIYKVLVLVFCLKCEVVFRCEMVF